MHLRLQDHLHPSESMQLRGRMAAPVTESLLATSCYVASSSSFGLIAIRPSGDCPCGHMATAMLCRKRVEAGSTHCILRVHRHREHLAST